MCVCVYIYTYIDSYSLTTKASFPLWWAESLNTENFQAVPGCKITIAHWKRCSTMSTQLSFDNFFYSRPVSLCFHGYTFI